MIIHVNKQVVSFSATRLITAPASVALAGIHFCILSSVPYFKDTGFNGTINIQEVATGEQSIDFIFSPVMEA
ncbi:hypothetical protein DWW23_23335 [Parabacteroides sp. AF14-59]|nr:hypothetical protein DWW23_23335 [Parabacteroides sp. AF14-59]